MRFRSLGNSGLLVSVAGLGCNNFGGRLDLQQTRAVVDAAIDAGITLFDTADIYGRGGGSEELLGQVLGSRRDQIVLASKFGHQTVDMGYGPAAGAKGGRGLHPPRRRPVAAPAAHRLHRPIPAAHPGSGDPDRGDPAALTELVAEGKVRYIGHSNLAGWQIADAAHLARQAGTGRSSRRRTTGRCWSGRPRPRWCPRARHFGLGVLPYFPLANGLLTGKVRRGQGVPA